MKTKLSTPAAVLGLKLPTSTLKLRLSSFYKRLRSFSLVWIRFSHDEFWDLTLTLALLSDLVLPGSENPAVKRLSDRIASQVVFYKYFITKPTSFFFIDSDIKIIRRAITRYSEYLAESYDNLPDLQQQNGLRRYRRLTDVLIKIS